MFILCYPHCNIHLRLAHAQRGMALPTVRRVFLGQRAVGMPTVRDFLAEPPVLVCLYLVLFSLSYSYVSFLSFLRSLIFATYDSAHIKDERNYLENARTVQAGCLPRDNCVTPQGKNVGMPSK